MALVSGVQGAAISDLMADLILSTAIAIVCFSDLISVLRDSSSLA